MTSTWRSKAVYPYHKLYRHSQKHRNWVNYTVGHYTTGVSTCPASRGARHFPSTAYFSRLVCTQCPHIFATQKQYWWDVNSETIHRQLLHLVSIQECWIIKEKWRFVKSIRLHSGLTVVESGRVSELCVAASCEPAMQVRMSDISLVQTSSLC